jgi:chromosome segregation ATPase
MVGFSLQEAEAARQIAAMQASLERLQSERETLRREVAEAAARRTEAETQVRG